MLTPRAQDLADRCRRTEGAVAAYARIAAEGFAVRVCQSEEERAALAERTTGVLVAIGVGLVRQAREETLLHGARIVEGKLRLVGWDGVVGLTRQVSGI